MHFDESRSEARSVPNLLVAPTSPSSQPKEPGIYDDYPQGYYADGTYTATPLPSDSNTTKLPEAGEVGDLDPQDAYYSALCARFSELCAILQDPPPSAEMTSPPTLTYTRREWRNKLLKITPRPTVLARISQEAVILGLEVLEDVLTAGNLRSEYGKNIGAWAWGLLARCRDMGMMGSEEVGVLRMLGKKAVWLLRRIAAGEVIQEEEVEDGETEEKGYEDERDDEVDMRNTDVNGDTTEIEASSQTEIDPTTATNQDTSPSKAQDDQLTLDEARQRILSSLEPTNEIQKTSNPIDANTLPSPNHHHVPEEEANSTTTTPIKPSVDQQAIHATLDMIVTIVGEFYGQKDLLDGRLLWDEMD